MLDEFAKTLGIERVIPRGAAEAIRTAIEHQARVLPMGSTRQRDGLLCAELLGYVLSHWFGVEAPRMDMSVRIPQVGEGPRRADSPRDAYERLVTPLVREATEDLSHQEQVQLSALDAAMVVRERKSGEPMREKGAADMAKMVSHMVACALYLELDELCRDIALDRDRADAHHAAMLAASMEALSGLPIESSLLNDWGTRTQDDGEVCEVPVEVGILESLRLSLDMPALELRNMLADRKIADVSRASGRPLTHDFWRAELAISGAPGVYGPLWWEMPFVALKDAMRLRSAVWLGDRSLFLGPGHKAPLEPPTGEVEVLRLTPSAARGFAVLIDMTRLRLFRNSDVTEEGMRLRPFLEPNVSVRSLEELRARLVEVGGDPWADVRGRVARRERGAWRGQLAEAWAVGAADARSLYAVLRDNSRVMGAVKSVAYGEGVRALLDSEDYRTCVEFVTEELKLRCEGGIQLATRNGEMYDFLCEFGDDFCLDSARDTVGLTLPYLEAFEKAWGGHVATAHLRRPSGGFGQMTAEEVVGWCEFLSELCDRSLERIADIRAGEACEMLSAACLRLGRACAQCDFGRSES